MYLLIIAVLGLLVLTRFYKLDQIKSVRHFRLAWTCMIASIVVTAAGHLLMMALGAMDRAECADFTNAAMLTALAVSLYFWQKAVTAGSNKEEGNA